MLAVHERPAMQTGAVDGEQVQQISFFACIMSILILSAHHGFHAKSTLITLCACYACPE
jgi:hypothetical protein